MTEKRLSEDDLAEQWFSFQLKVWRMLKQVVAAEKANGVAQKAIAERIGMSEPQFSRLLSGRSNVTLRTMHKVARALGYRPEVEFVRVGSLMASNVPQTGTGTISYIVPNQMKATSVSTGKKYATTTGTDKSTFKAVA